MPEGNEAVLVLAPTGRDAVLISEALRANGFESQICSGLEEFALQLQRQPAAGVLAQEALHSGATAILKAALREQPAWSDIPLILMTSRRSPGTGVSNFLGQGVNVTLLERPLRSQTLAMAVRSAIRQRKRQYELRDRLADQEKTEERLRQTQKLESLGILAGGIAHDFNNLLTGIIGNISLVLEHAPVESRSRKYLEEALQASDRAADLTRQLLAYSGKGRFSVQLLDLSEEVRQINALIQSSIPKSVRVLLHLAPGLPAVEADSAQLHQILMNLIINGAEAIGADTEGFVVVETGTAVVDERYLLGTLGAESAAPGEYVYVEVRDTGCGIDEATLPRIFDPFFTTKFMGRGLGLAAVLGIVRGHGGALKVNSTPGSGTSFRVLFPAVRETAAVPAQKAGNTDFCGSGTILVVDDEEIVRKIAKSALESWGYRVLLAENGQVALDLFVVKTEISLVLLDFTMPVMNGEQTFHRLQRIRPGVKVLLTSGYDETDAIRSFPGGGLAGFLQKPYTAAQLGASVKRALGGQSVIAADG